MVWCGPARSGTHGVDGFHFCIALSGGLTSPLVCEQLQALQGEVGARRGAGGGTTCCVRCTQGTSGETQHVYLLDTYIMCLIIIYQIGIIILDKHARSINKNITLYKLGYALFDIEGQVWQVTQRHVTVLVTLRSRERVSMQGRPTSSRGSRSVKRVKQGSHPFIRVTFTTYKTVNRELFTPRLPQSGG